MLRLAVVLMSLSGCLCLPQEKDIIDYLIQEADNLIKESYKNITILHDSFQYKFNDHFVYSSNYSLRDFSSGIRARDSPPSVNTVARVQCAPMTSRFTFNVELQMKVFELLYNSQWKLFFFNYNGNMTISNSDLRGRLEGEILVDESKKGACKTTARNLTISRWGDFKLHFSNDSLLYRPLEKILSFVLTVHVPKVLNGIISKYSTNFTAPDAFTNRICPYFLNLARSKW